MFLPLQLCAMARRAILLLCDLLAAGNFLCITASMWRGCGLCCVVRGDVTHVLFAQRAGNGLHAATFAALVAKLKQLVKDRQLWLRS